MVSWDALVGRLKFLRQAGITFGGKRDTYEILGYSRVLTAYDYVDRYFRGGIAGRIVDLFPNATWRGGVFLSEKEDDADPTPNTTFEKAWVDLDRRLQIQATCRTADVLSQLSTYSCILIGVEGDGDDLSVELPKGTPDKVMYLKAFLGAGGPTSASNRNRPEKTLDVADISVLSFDTDATSKRFGKVKEYQIHQTNLANPMLQRPVHWSRVIHIADNALFDDVYGTPRLERVWNDLDDLDKIKGGGAEAFWLRANPGMHLNVDKDMTFPPAKPGEKSELEKVSDQADQYAHQQTRFIRTRGVDVTPLGSQVADNKGPFDTSVTAIAGALGIPKRILVGAEMGELASSTDRENWRDQINGRQTQHAGPNIMRNLANRLIAYGYLPPPSKGPDEYYVIWAHIQTLTETEKTAGALSWAQTYTVDKKPAFLGEEIRRKWYGMDPIPPDKLAAASGAAAGGATFDAQGNPITVTQDADGNLVDQNGNPVTEVYDQNGNRMASAPDDAAIEQLVLHSGLVSQRAFDGSNIAMAVKRAGAHLEALQQPLAEVFTEAYLAAKDDLEQMRGAEGAGHPFHGNQWTGEGDRHVIAVKHKNRFGKNVWGVYDQMSKTFVPGAEFRDKGEARGHAKELNKK